MKNSEHLLKNYMLFVHNAKNISHLSEITNVSRKTIYSFISGNVVDKETFDKLMTKDYYIEIPRFLILSDSFFISYITQRSLSFVRLNKLRSDFNCITISELKVLNDSFYSS